MTTAIDSSDSTQSTSQMTSSHHASAERLHKELIAGILAHLDFGKEKLKLQIVSKTWKDALQLSAAHPDNTFRDLWHPHEQDIAFPYQFIAEGLDRMASLNTSLQYMRRLKTCQALPSLRKLELQSDDGQSTPVRLPRMPKLQEMSLCASDGSGRHLMRTGLIELSNLETFRFTSEREGDEEIPTICVASGCEVSVDMVTVVYRSMPVQTSMNLTKLGIGLESSHFPDLRSCVHLRTIQFWVQDAEPPGDDPLIMQGMNMMPDALQAVRLVAIGMVVVEDRDGFCQLRTKDGMSNWTTHILSLERVEAADDLSDWVSFQCFKW